MKKKQSKKQGKYVEPKRIKVGKYKYVCDYNNKPIVGLSFDCGNGTYFYTHFQTDKDFRAKRKTRKDYSFGVDYAAAVFRFKQWISDNQKLSLTLPTDIQTEQTITKTLSEQERQSLQEIYTDLGVVKEVPTQLTFGSDNFETDNKNYSVISHIQTDKQYALHLAKQLLQNEEIKIEIIRLLKLNDLLPKEYKILPIKDILDYYIENSPTKKREKCSMKKVIKDFITITKKQNVNDVSEDDVLLFKDYVMNEYQSKNLSTSYVNSCWQKFKTVFYFYQKNKRLNGEKELISKLLDNSKKLVMIPKKIKVGAKSIDTKTMKILFDKARQDKEVYLMFLLMLNTGFYPTDIRNLKKDMVKEQDGLTYIHFNRLKTAEQFVRINCLWSITAKLLKEHIKEQNTDSEYVFISNFGTIIGEASLYLRLKEYCKNLYHSDNTAVSAKHFRDTVASSIAFKVQNINIMKITLGHCITNKEDFWKYVQTNPIQQKQAADILFDIFKDCL